MVVREVLGVIYSPVKTFKKIVEKPNFKGVFLVLVLVMSAMILVQFVAASKINVETRTPESDDWTEVLVSTHAWTSNGVLSLDSIDYQMGNTNGNHSVASLAQNQTGIWMKLMDIGSVDCSGETGYNQLFFWVNWTNEYNIADLLASNSEWGNVTLSVGSNQGWTANNSPDWAEITGLEFSLEWSAPTNLTLKLDGVHFSKFVPFLDVAGVGGVIQLAFVNLALPFAIDWIVWSGILLIVAKMFTEELGPWNNFFTIVGYSYIVTFIYTLLNMVAIASLPVINLPIDTTLATAAINQTWVPVIWYQISNYLPIIERVWLAGLAAIIIKTMKDIPMGKVLTIVAISFGLRYLLSMFLF
ncbi:MAG: hypothetical protein WC325_07900 [Candidatus Bathyarchaeia archaeon]|jgi:hypothetical protein